MSPHRDLTDLEWRRVAPLLPELQPRRDMRGRPLANTRAVLNGALWVMYSNATWSSMPRRYPPYQTCHRRFKMWMESGVLQRVMDVLFGADGQTLLLTVAAKSRRRTSRDRSHEGQAAHETSVCEALSASSAIVLPARAALPSPAWAPVV